MVIIPALLTDDRDTLNWMIKTCECFCKYVHIDIMDGEFVPSRSIPPNELLNIKTSLRIEAHLMTTSPQDHIEVLLGAGVFKIIFHFEATNDPFMVIHRIRKKGIEVGMAINPATELREIEGILDHLDSLLLLSVDPGFYGSKFIPNVLDKARELKAKRPNYKIGMDGGLKLGNILMVKEAGVDMACIGSAILRSEDPKGAFLSFEEITKG